MPLAVAKPKNPFLVLRKQLEPEFHLTRPLNLIISLILLKVGKKFDLGPPIVVPKQKVVDKIASKRQIICKLSEVMGYNTNLSTNSHECPKNCKLCPADD